jgi:hypothetical protein
MNLRSNGPSDYRAVTVSPITVEPTKPRMCINLMYLNCFMKDTPFNLETLVDVPRTVEGGSFLTKLYDKSGYDNVFVTNSSRKLLGFQGGGYYFSVIRCPLDGKTLRMCIIHVCYILMID